MDLDPYQPCPCGSGKKLKFCCCSDILPELDRVLRILDGDQRAAGLDALDKLLAKHPNRAALLSLKATVQAEAGQFEEAEKTADACLVQQPTSSVALALKAMFTAVRQNGTAAIDLLQTALESCGENVPLQVYQAIGVVARRLLSDGEIFSGRAHAILQASFAGENDPQALQELLQVNASPQVPLLFKTESNWPQCDPNATWKAEYEIAAQSAEHGTWRKALGQFQALATRATRDTSVIRSMALLHGYLGHRDEAVNWLRKFVAVESLPLDERVEAEGLAQLLDPTSYKTRIDHVRVAITVHDAEKAQETFLSEKAAVRMPVDFPPGGEDQPPPKSAFWILDRALPATHEGLARTDVPRVLGEAFLYGKQTDRAARIELEVERDDRFAAAQEALRKLLGDVLGDVEKEEVIGGRPAANSVLSWQWRLPDDTPPAVRRQLTQEERKDILLNRWPKVALDSLGGRTPAEAARDPAHPAPALAAVLLLELANERNGDVDFNELRRKLGLPTSDPIDPAKFDALRIPPARFHRLRVDKLADEALLTLISRASMYGCTAACRHLAEELAKRKQLHDKLDLATVYGIVAEDSTDSEEALKYLKLAQDASLEKRRSPARWLLAELGVRLNRGEVEHVQRLIMQIQGQHLREPGVAESLYSLMLQYGIIRPEDLRAAGVQVAPPGTRGAGRGPGVRPAAAPAPAAPAGGLWTPGAAASPAPPAAGEKSKLWLPGT